MSEIEITLPIKEIKKIIFKKRFILFLFSFFIYSFALVRGTSSGPDGLTYALQYFLVYHHTFSIGTYEHPFITALTDQFNINGYLYGKQSYGFAFILMPFFLIGSILDNGFYNVLGYGALFDRFGVAFISAILVEEFYRLYTSLYPDRESFGFSLALILGFGTTIFPFTELIYYHSFGALAALEFVFYNYRYMLTNKSFKSALLSSILFGIGAYTDPSTLGSFIFLIVFVFVVQLIFEKDVLRKMQAFIISASGFLILVLLVLLIDYVAFGNPFFIYLTSGARFYGIRLTLLHSIYYLFSPYRGLLFYTPVVLLGLAMLIKKFKQRPILSMMILGSFLANLFFVSSWYYWDGGLSFGPRFLIVSFPLLMLFIDSSPFVYILGAYSIVVNLAGTSFVLPPVSPTNWTGFGKPTSFYGFYYVFHMIFTGKALWYLVTSYNSPLLSTAYYFILLVIILLAMFLPLITFKNKIKIWGKV